MSFAEISVLIFLFAFVSCIPVEVMVIGEPYRFVDVLEANSSAYLLEIRNALLYSTLLPALGLVLILVEFIKHRKTFLRWHLGVGGGFLFFWGLFALSYVYTAYCYAMNAAIQLNFPIGNLLSTIYAVHLMAKMLWLIAGFLLMHPYVYSMLHSEWNKYKRDG
jgi:hypothetical protein